MYLSEFQKEILKSISQQKIKNVENFLRYYCDLDEALNEGVTFGTNFGQYNAGIKVFIPKNIIFAENQLKEFIILWDKLEKEGLIITVPRERTFQYTFPIFSRDCLYHNQHYKTAPLETILIIIKDREYKEIVSTQELSKFIENQYLTNDEAKQKEEKEDRIGSQKLTRKVAYTSISISIIVSVISMIFNYLAYTTKREVIISNPKAFKDTISVYIINGKDSIQFVNSG